MQDLLARRMPVGVRASARALCLGCALSLLALVVGGCASTPPDAPSTPARRGVGVSVIQSVSFRFDWETRIDPVQVDIERCAQRAIADHDPSLRLVPHAELASALTPDLPPGAAPLSLASVRVLLGEPSFRATVDRLSLRYIVIVAGDTEIAAHHAWIAGAGYGGAVVMGVSTWEKRTGVSAVILDLRRPTAPTELEVRSSGTSWVGGILPLAVGYRASTEEQACRQIADQIAETLALEVKGGVPP